MPRLSKGLRKNKFPTAPGAATAPFAGLPHDTHSKRKRARWRMTAAWQMRTTRSK